MFPHQSDVHVWEVPGLTPRVVYSGLLMDRLAGEAQLAAGESSPAQTAGVLLGRIEAKEIHVVEAVPIQEEREIQGVLEQTQADPAFRGLTPVGLYRSRTGSGVAMSRDDLRLFDRYFPLPGHVMLVLCPGDGNSIPAGFFFRPHRGAMKTDSSFLLFEAGPAARSTSDSSALDARGTAAGSTSTLGPPAALFSEARRRMPHGRIRVIPLAVLLVACGAIAALYLWPSEAQESEDPGLSLRVLRRGAGVGAVWDVSAGAIRSATQAKIEVNDGGQVTRVNLPPPLLQSGEWLIHNESRDVRVTLKVQVAGREIAETARYIGAASPTPAARPQAEANAEANKMYEEMQALENERKRLAEENRRLEARYEELQRQSARQSTVTGSARLSAAPGRPTSPPSGADRAETTANRTAEERSTSPSPTPLFGNRGSPGVKPAPPSPPPQTPAATTSGEVGVASGPQPESSAEPYSGPSFGRVIWTGYLKRGDSVTAEGRRATQGTLNGTLPRAPLRVTIYPGDLSGAGVRLYSGDRSHAARNSFEPKSAANGWQETRFAYDAERAGGVVVAETPSGRNGYKLVFRCIGKPVSVVLIEWRVQR